MLVNDPAGRPLGFHAVQRDDVIDGAPYAPAGVMLVREPCLLRRKPYLLDRAHVINIALAQLQRTRIYDHRARVLFREAVPARYRDVRAESRAR
jgi:hypothetical protein